MTRAVFFVTLRELLSQPVRLGSLLGACLIPLVATTIDPAPVLAEAFWAIVFAVLSSAGIIGQEMTSGTLALVFARPIRRSTYVFSRWSAAATLASTMSVLQLVLQGFIFSVRARPIPIATLFLGSTDRIFLAVGVTAVFTLLSCLSAGFGDIVIWSALNIVAEILQLAGKEAALPQLVDVGRCVAFFANPTFDIFAIQWSQAFLYVGTVAGCLALAGWSLNRRQLTYASG